MDCIDQFPQLMFVLNQTENRTDILRANDSTIWMGNGTDDVTRLVAKSPVGAGILATVEQIIYTKVMLIVAVFGLVGNLLNLLVLSQKSLTYSMERMEKSAHYGLIGLAISDMLICVAILPSAYVGTGRFGYPNLDFRLIYLVYGPPIINTFILTSTWLTVSMAFSRFLAICYPFKGKQFIGKTFALTSLTVVFVACALFNVPRYFWKTLFSFKCENGSVVHFAIEGPMMEHKTIETIYMWLYFTVGILIPLLILIFCNTHLILALRRSMRMRMESHASRHNSQAANRITLTLIIIVIMYVLFFVPAEILNFLKDVTTSETTDVYNLTLTTFNLLQAINFAMNFVLYCAINTHFRQTVCRLVCSSRCRSRRFSGKAPTSANSLNRHYGSLTEASSYV